MTQRREKAEKFVQVGEGLGLCSDVGLRGLGLLQSQIRRGGEGGVCIHRARPRMEHQRAGSHCTCSLKSVIITRMAGNSMEEPEKAQAGAVAPLRARDASKSELAKRTITTLVSAWRQAARRASSRCCCRRHRRLPLPPPAAAAGRRPTRTRLSWSTGPGGAGQRGGYVQYPHSLWLCARRSGAGSGSRRPRLPCRRALLVRRRTLRPGPSRG